MACRILARGAVLRGEGLSEPGFLQKPGQIGEAHLGVGQRMGLLGILLGLDDDPAANSPEARVNTETKSTTPSPGTV